MTRPGLPSLTVVVPCRNERDYISQCLDSILSQDYPRDRIAQILVVDGQSDDGTREIVERYVRRNPTVRLVDNPRRIPAAALNIGIQAAEGEVVVRLDAHATYPATYLSRLVPALEAHGADNVGGVISTVPANDSAIARAIAVALSHPFGVGDSYFRIGTTEPRWVDTIAFFCCRREVLERLGGFDEELARGEDCEFNFRLRDKGGRVLLVPGVEARYYARRTLKQLAQMLYQYGYFKALLMRKMGRVLSLRQFVPSGFVVALLGSAILSLWVPLARLPFALVAGAYVLALVLSSVHAGRTQGIRTMAVLPVAFAFMHFSYGIGFLKGIGDHILGYRSRPLPVGAVRLSR
jgi:glycosyltransferase involved in cell wall biosynthesis